MQAMLSEELSPSGSLGHSLKIPADLQWTHQSRSCGKAVVSCCALVESLVGLRLEDGQRETRREITPCHILLRILPSVLSVFCDLKGLGFLPPYSLTKSKCFEKPVATAP